MNERVRRLENRLVPTAPPSSPGMDLMLKLASHARAELDYQDRAAEATERGRLQEGAGPPEPLVLTLAERREMLENSVSFLDYLDGQRARNRGLNAAHIDEAERVTREDITRLKEEIATMVSMEGAEND